LIRCFAHLPLNSSTANLGGTRVAQAAKECEAPVRNGGVANLAPLLALLRNEYRDFCAALTIERPADAA
jgi:hypothetical protein